MKTYSGIAALEFLLNTLAEADPDEGIAIEIALATRRRDGKLCFLFTVGDEGRAALTAPQLQQLPGCCELAIAKVTDDDVRIALEGLANLARKTLDALTPGVSAHGPH